MGEGSNVLSASFLAYYTQVSITLSGEGQCSYGIEDKGNVMGEFK